MNEEFPQEIKENAFDEQDFDHNNICHDQEICGGKLLKKYVHEHSLDFPNEEFGNMMRDSIFKLKIAETCKI